MSALDKQIKKDIREYTPIEHVIFRVWCEAQENDSSVILHMAETSADELAAFRAGRDEQARKLKVYADFVDSLNEIKPHEIHWKISNALVELASALESIHND